MASKKPIRANLGLSLPKPERTSIDVAQVVAEPVPAARAGEPDNPIAEALNRAAAPAPLTPDEVLASFPGQTINAPASICVESKLNARVNRTAAEIDQMLRWLQEDGQDMPAKGFIRDGKVVVADGVTRLLAVRIGNLPFLRVELVDPPETPLQEYLLSARLNDNRKSHTSLDCAIRYRDLMALGVGSQAALPALVERSAAWVSQCMSLLAIPDRVQRYAMERESAKKHGVLYELSLAFKDKETIERLGEEGMIRIAEEAIDEIERKEMGRDTAKAFLARKFATPRARASADKVKVEFWGREGSLKAFPKKGRLDFSIEGLDAEALKELERQVTEFFSRHAKPKAAAAGH